MNAVVLFVVVVAAVVVASQLSALIDYAVVLARLRRRKNRVTAGKDQGAFLDELLAGIEDHGGGVKERGKEGSHTRPDSGARAYQ